MKSFAEILLEKLDGQHSKLYKPFIEIDGNDPQHLAYLMGQLPKWEAGQWSNLTEQKSRNLNQYATQKSRQTKETKLRQTDKPLKTAPQNEEMCIQNKTLNHIQKETVQTPKHQLSSEQKDALKYFSNLGVYLTMSFSKDELRSGFRKLALKCHPDRQPETQKEKATRTFQDLKVAYEQLKTVFT
jgi:hypothetical protein